MADLDPSSEGLFALGIVFIAAWLALSALRRRMKGRPIRPEAPADSIFVEAWTSGRSLRSFITRLAGARRCLLVAVTPDALVIHPHFPFSIGFVCGLDWTIPRASIRRVSTRRRFTRDNVVIEFAGPQAQDAAVELSLREPEDFRRALGARDPTGSPK